ncbi:MAG: J domain-containing protein [Tissierellia bacterium]|nr:J domain-containing protein [Tissierellia bacterium]
MGAIKQMWGSIIKGTANVLNGLFSFLIIILEIPVKLLIIIGRALGTIISMGGCLALVLLGPAILSILPVILVPAIVLIAVLVLGQKLISLLKYWQFAVTEYLYDRSTFYKEGKKVGYGTVGDYGQKYYRMKEEEERKRQEERRREQDRMWEEQFRQWYEYQRSYQQSGGRREYSTGGQRTYQDPTSDFVNKYEEACKTLRLSTDTDEYQVKLAYRKLAKEYHPDINKAPDATAKFQQINDAYSLLTAVNIQRYRRLKGK